MRGTGPLPERSPERRSAHRPARARWAALALALLAATASATAEDPGLETRVKAAYVYNFLTFVEREKPEPEPEGAPVRVCVLGDEALLAQLKGLSAARSAAGPSRSSPNRRPVRLLPAASSSSAAPRRPGSRRSSGPSRERAS